MKTKLIILLVMTLMTSVIFSQTKNDSTNKSTSKYKNYWQVKINFDLPTLDPEAIQIAWLDFDPNVKFNLKFDTTYLGQQLRFAKNEKEKSTKISIECEVTWNFMFDVVKGSEMYLLSKQGNTLSCAADYTQSKMKKWLVSKVFMLDNKPYAYAIPFELENGSKFEVTLNKSNLISLIDLYEKIKK